MHHVQCDRPEYLIVPALAEDSVAGETADDLVLTGGFLGGDFFFC